MTPMTPQELVDRICAERGLRNTRRDDGGSDQQAARERKASMGNRLLVDGELITRKAESCTAEVWGEK